MTKTNLYHCDGCDKLRKDIQSVGKDGNGEPDAPDLCFLCRKEADRGNALKTDPPLVPFVNIGFRPCE